MVFPCIESATGGELCFISSTHGDRRLQSNCFGNLMMVRNWKGWEVWRFVRSGRDEDNSFFISSWTHSDFYLSSHPGGHVTTSKNRLGWELWTVEGTNTSNNVHIRSVEHGRLLQYRDGHLSTVEPSALSDQSLWNLKTANLGKFFLRCNEQAKQIGCPQNVDEAPFLTENRKEWEVWRLEEAEEANNFSIRSDAHGWYLRSDQERNQVHISPEPGAEMWYLASRQGSMVLVSSFGGYLACNSEGHIYMTRESGDKRPCTSWSLEPHMPGTISGKQIGALVGVGSLTLGLAIAAPFAIVGCVTGMGFTAGGIAAGSTAAGMMSAEAIAAGGAVAAGGTVATLQSIGAVGLGMAGTAAAVSGGAAVGVGISATALGTSGVMQNGNSSAEAGVLVASENLASDATFA